MNHNNIYYSPVNDCGGFWYWNYTIPTINRGSGSGLFVSASVWSFSSSSASYTIIYTYPTNSFSNVVVLTYGISYVSSCGNSTRAIIIGSAVYQNSWQSMI